MLEVLGGHVPAAVGGPRWARRASCVRLASQLRPAQVIATLPLRYRQDSQAQGRTALTLLAATSLLDAPAYHGEPCLQRQFEPASTSETAWPCGLARFYVIGKILGTGAYGIVRLAIDKRTGHEVAVKELPKVRGKLSEQKTLRKIRQEVELLQALRGSCNVVSLHEVYQDDASVFLVLDMCHGADLEKLLESQGTMTERQVALVIYEVLKVVQACHEADIVHGDVKPANFILQQRYLDPLAAIQSGEVLRCGPWLKAVDFGCSQRLPHGSTLTRRTGTPVFMAPEVFHRSYGKPSDMWSVGMMFYQLYAGRFPFWPTVSDCRTRTLEEVMQAVTSRSIPTNYGPWLQLSTAGLSLIKQLLQRDPRKRITVAQALEHEWFRQHGLGTVPRNCGIAPAQGCNNILPGSPRCQPPAYGGAFCGYVPQYC